MQQNWKKMQWKNLKILFGNVVVIKLNSMNEKFQILIFLIISDMLTIDILLSHGIMNMNLVILMLCVAALMMMKNTMNLTILIIMLCLIF